MNVKEACAKFKALKMKMFAYSYAMSTVYTDAVTAAPAQAAEPRGEAMAILTEEIYKLSTAPEVPELLRFLKKHEQALSDLTRREVDEMLKDFEKISKVPMERYIEIQRLSNMADSVWHAAKVNNDYASFAPYLEKLVDAQIELAGYFAPDRDPYDYWLDEHEKGFTAEKLDVFFNKLRERIVPLLAKIREVPQIDDSFLFLEYPAHLQKKFAEYLMDVENIDKTRCTLGETEHPFTNGQHKKDVRITTHYYENALASSMYTVLHEGGHALYELNMGDDLQYSNLNGGTSMGIHECQSRLYENIIGRSLAFIHVIFPKVTELFPEQMKGVTEEMFYRAVNKAEPSLIRTEADELTYPLHVMVRYELEKKMFKKELAIADVPAAWNAAMKEYLGVEVPNDREGCLQDSHWGGSMFGYFPSYALGSAYGAQIIEEIKKDLPVDDLIAAGDLAPITAWLTERIYKYGSARKPDEVLAMALNGKEFDPEYYIRYLENKYTALYGLQR